MARPRQKVRVIDSKSMYLVGDITAVPLLITFIRGAAVPPPVSPAPSVDEPTFRTIGGGGGGGGSRPRVDGGGGGRTREPEIPVSVGGRGETE